MFDILDSASIVLEDHYLARKSKLLGALALAENDWSRTLHSNKLACLERQLKSGQYSLPKIEEESLVDFINVMTLTS